MPKPDNIPQDVWDTAESITGSVGYYSPHEFSVMVADDIMAAKRDSLEAAAKLAEDGFWTPEALTPGALTAKGVWRGKYPDGPAIAQAIRSAALE